MKKMQKALPPVGSGARFPTVRLRQARGRTTSSQRWLLRQLNDPYVHRAKALGYRARAAFKLEELDDKWKFLKPKHRVVDLGAAPGGWTQVAVQRTFSDENAVTVLGVDLLPIDPIAGATFVQGNFLEEGVISEVLSFLKQPVHVVLSDMAASSSGHSLTDHIRIMALAEAAFFFAKEVLMPGGTYVAKTLQGGTEKTLLGVLKKHFKQVVHAKPAASRSDSAEMYVLAFGFRP